MSQVNVEECHACLVWVWRCFPVLLRLTRSSPLWEVGVIKCMVGGENYPCLSSAAAAA